MPVKMNEKSFINKVSVKHEDRFCYDKVIYKDATTPVIVTCKVHGDFLISPRNHLRGKGGCALCSGGIRLSNDQFTAKAKQVHGDKYNYSKVEYKDHASKVIIGCPHHGEFSQVADYHLQGNGCPKCAGRITHTKKDFLGELPEKHRLNNNYDYSLIPNRFSPKSVLSIICSQHGSFTTNYGRFISKGHGCRGCSGHAKKDSTQFVQEANNIHGDKYDYERVQYKSSHDLVTIICPKHGEFTQSPSNHLQGKTCPRCANHISSQEDRIYEAFPFFQRTNRDIIKPYHLDLYSAEHTLAIEVNGRYWHSEERGKGQMYHVNKTEECSKVGISLLHFWDDEVDSKFPIIESMIRARTDATEKVFARNTKLGSPTKEETVGFLNENHLQGYTAHSKVYGLYQEKTLVAVMSFGKPRFDKTHEWEILRFATKLNTTIIGGASKLFKAFILGEQPKSIVTYADRRYSEGKIYEKLGFSFSHNAKPNYFYIKNGININRYAAQKHKLSKLLGDRFDPELSEYDNMLANGYKRVYDCGNKVFTWSK